MYVKIYKKKRGDKDGIEGTTFEVFGFLYCNW